MTYNIYKYQLNGLNQLTLNVPAGFESQIYIQNVTEEEAFGLHSIMIRSFLHEQEKKSVAMVCELMKLKEKTIDWLLIDLFHHDDMVTIKQIAEELKCSVEDLKKCLLDEDLQKIRAYNQLIEDLEAAPVKDNVIDDQIVKDLDALILKLSSQN